MRSFDRSTRLPAAAAFSSRTPFNNCLSDASGEPHLVEAFSTFMAVLLVDDNAAGDHFQTPSAHKTARLFAPRSVGLGDCVNKCFVVLVYILCMILCGWSRKSYLTVYRMFLLKFSGD